MEMLLFVEQQRNQYCGQTKSQGHARFGSSPSTGFGGISYWEFQSDIDILPTPLRSSSTPFTVLNSVVSSNSPKSSSHCPKSPSFDTKLSKMYVKSSPIPINLKVRVHHENQEMLYENFSYSELWAGPAYSNSPPPSSLPIPNFNVRVKKSVSLDLPVSDHFNTIHPIGKSAPPSPNREHNPFKRDLFNIADSATKTLRHILNLDDTD